MNPDKETEFLASILKKVLGEKIPPNILEEIKNAASPHFASYNKALSDLQSRYARHDYDYQQLQTSTDNKIKNLKKENVEQEERFQERLTNVTANLRKEKEEFARLADADREEWEKEKEKLEEARKQAYAEISTYRIQAKQAREDEDAAFKALEEERDDAKVLKMNNESLERARDDMRREAKNWQNETDVVTKLKENLEKELNACRNQLAPLREEKRALEHKVDELRSELKFAKETIAETQEALAECQTKLRDTEEDLAKYRPSSSMGSTTSGSPVKGTILRDQIGDLSQSTTPSPVSSKSAKSPVSAGSSGKQSQLLGLIRENERYKKLEAKIETDYVPREVHEQAISDKTKELETAKSEKNSVQQAEDNCQAKLKKLKDELAQKENDGKKDAATIKDLRAKVKELEKKVIRLESESNGLKREVAKQKERIQEQEKQLKQNKENISRLEQSERKQQTMIANGQTEQKAKDKEIKRLSDELKQTQKDLAKIQKKAEADAAELQKEKADMAELQDITGQMEKELKEAELERDNFEAKLGVMQKKLSELETANLQLQDAAHKSKNPNAKVENQKSSLKERDTQFAAIQEDNKKHRDEIKRLRKELDKVTLKSNENARAKTEADRFAKTLNDTVNSLEKQAKKNTDEIRQLTSLKERLDEQRDKLQNQVAQLTTDINRLKDKNSKLEEEKEATASTENEQIASLLSERDDLQANSQLAEDEQKRLEGEIKDHLEERSKLQVKIQELETAALAAGNEAGDVDARIAELQDKNTILSSQVAALEDDIETVNAERTALRAQLVEQGDVIGGNGQQADRTQAALNEQIIKLEAQQRDLKTSLETMSKRSMSQGLNAADTARSLKAARKEVERLQNLEQALIVQRDQLQDEVRLCYEAQRDARRLRRNPPGEPALALTHVPPPEADNGASDGAAVGAGRQVADKPSFFSRTGTIFVETVQYSTVWSILLTTFFFMVMVIIAEGRLYAQWRAANANTRALFMATNDRPTLCIGSPMFEFFWHTLAVGITGRWKYCGWT